MPSFLLIGGAGLVGCHLALQLHMDGHQVWIYDNLHAARQTTGIRSQINQELLKRVRSVSGFYEASVCDTQVLNQTIQAVKPDIVYYLAALLASESTRRPDQALATQVDGLRNTLEAISQYGKLQRFVMASSSYVYGDFEASIIDERHPRRPIDTYGRTKLIAEELVHIYRHSTGLEYCILRPAAIYGVGDARPRFAAQAIDMVIESQPVHIYDPSFISDFTYIEDAVQGFRLAAFVPEAANETFNMTYGEARTNTDFYTELASFFPGRLITLTDAAEEEGVILPKRGALDITKARNILGYQPKFNLRAGIQHYIDSYVELRGQM